MANISGIRILEKENNKKGDLFARLMKDLFFTLGYEGILAFLGQLFMTQ